MKESGRMGGGMEGKQGEDLWFWLQKHSRGRLKMKSGTDRPEDTAVLGIDGARRISIPT